jgi:hypothetical protein
MLALSADNARSTHAVGLESPNLHISAVGDSVEQPAIPAGVADGTIVEPDADLRLGEILTQEGQMSGDARRDLARAHEAAREKERIAWACLQNSRDTCTSAEREQHLRDWLEAMRAMRELQLQLTASIVLTVKESLRECVQAIASPACDPQYQSVECAPSLPAVQLRRPPQVDERLLAHDGTVWRVESVALDQVEEGFFLVHIQRETASGEPIDSIEVYSEDWPLYCLAYGLRLEPVGAPQEREVSKLPSNTLTVSACS